MALDIQKVGQISITVHDLDRAVAFYRDVLELEYVWQTGRMAFFNCGETRLLLGVPEGETSHKPSSILYYQVEDIHRSVELLKERGVVFNDTPHPIGRLGDITVWMTFFPDSEGNLLGIQSEVPAEN